MIFSVLYDFFKRYKFLLFLFIFIILTLSVYFSTQVKLQEDITKLIPNNDKITEFNSTFNNIKFLDKIVVNVFFTDSTKANSDSLINFTNTLTDTLTKEIKGKLADDIVYKVSNERMLESYNIIYNNLPLFLNKSDYNDIKTLLTDSNIKKTIESDYKSLMSPASIALKKFIIKDPLSLTAIVLKKLQTLQVDKNFNLQDGYIISKNNKNLLFFIVPKFSGTETGSNSKLISKIKNIITYVEKKYNYKIKAEFFGTPVVAVGNANRIKKDIYLTVTIAMILLLVLLTYFFRNKLIILIILLPVVFGALIGVASLAIFRTTISAVSLGVGSVLLGISIDYALHLITHLRDTKNKNITLKDISLPMLMSSATTAIAFLCLFFVHSDALHDLALFSSISVTASALITLILLPHLIKNIDKTKTNKTNFIDKIAGLNYHKKKWLNITIVVLTIIFTLFLKHVKFDGDLMKINYLSPELTQTQKNLNKISNISNKTIYIVAKASNLQKALRLSERLNNKFKKLQKNKAINYYINISDFYMSDSLANIRKKQWINFWNDSLKIKTKNKLIKYSKQYKFKENTFNKFYKLINNKFDTINKQELNNLKNLVLNDYIVDSDSLKAVVTMIKTDNKNRFKIYNSFKNIKNTIILDKQYITEQFIGVLKKDFNRLVTISLILVFLFLLIIFGRIELTLITYIPMLVSWVWTLGLMSVFGLKFNILNIIISTFIFGLGIDYSIFITRGLLQKYQFNVDNIKSYKTSILLSSITTILGIGVLIFAKHPALKSIASLSIIGILSVIIISFTLQPVMFNFLIKNRGKKRKMPVNTIDLFFSIIAFSVFITFALISTIIGLILFYLVPAKKSFKQLLLHYIIYFESRIFIFIMFNVKKKYINLNRKQFSKPAIIIANHQSHIDILLMLALHPKMILLTTDWVQNNPFYGLIVRMLEFYPVSKGIENGFELIKEKVKQGYNIVIFPEGHRQIESKIKRFHKGAFYLSEKLKLDIIPILLHGLNFTLTKYEIYLKSSIITLKILPRIKFNDNKFGQNYSEKGKNINKYMRSEFLKLRKQIETPDYYKRLLINNYIYKGPVLEWYLKIKIRLEKNYKIFNDIVPRSAEIYDVGCGYGFLSYMLNLVSEQRKITGIDYDCKKIETAKNCGIKNDNVNFICDDVTKFNFNKADVFIINDVIHYLLPDQQSKLIETCIKNLKNNGILILRDANKELKKRHFGTRYTEFFSTNSGFNKTANKLNFTSKQQIINIINKFNVTYEIIDNTKLTSNIIFIIKQQVNE